MNALKEAFDNVMKMNHDIIKQCNEAIKTENNSLKYQDYILTKPVK